MHILLVDDEQKFALALRQGLEEEGYEVETAFSGEAALRSLESRTPDLILLDIMLPRRGGLSILHELRRDGQHIPVLLLTALQSVEDRVHGLDAGADDYLAKPFAFPELLARIRALLRRPTIRSQTVTEYAGLSIDRGTHIASRDGKPLELTSREFDLLEYLIVNHDRVVSREMLTSDVWRETLRYTSLDNVIDVQIARLRRKIDDPFDSKLLHTVRGVGFILRKE